MSFEAIAGIAKAEADAKELIAAAKVKARQCPPRPKNEGKAAVEAACAKADSELTELRKQADAKAMTEAGGFRGDGKSEGRTARQSRSQT
ncbi:MAG: hypothetical protein V8S72_08765 [Oscillospiraceae bacterium]